MVCPLRTGAVYCGLIGEPTKQPAKLSGEPIKIRFKGHSAAHWDQYHRGRQAGEAEPRHYHAKGSSWEVASMLTTDAKQHSACNATYTGRWGAGVGCFRRGWRGREGGMVSTVADRSKKLVIASAAIVEFSRCWTSVCLPF